MTVLILGGTAEARELALLLSARGVPFVSSLAGRVARPRLPVGDVRIGGFGGVEGLACHLRENGVAAVVDATHPFASGISRNAARACALEGVPLLRLERPGWEAAPGSDSWNWVGTHEEAAATAARLGRAPFLTTGRQTLGCFLGPLAEARAVVRVVDPPEVELPRPWTLLRSRGPYTLDGERELLRRYGCDVLVTKDSGGGHTWPKMLAAGELGLAVVVVRRESRTAGVDVVGDHVAAGGWLAERGLA
ncbi:cobalt-precorrin-6A reductase [Planomonospora corallina]|uniref:Cobalt-precorrin-6A reductase n=1 Tax=Planomonospora corallina TaxID=1806052 RepID=A0ABV8I4D4_9ACTN